MPSSSGLPLRLAYTPGGPSRNTDLSRAPENAVSGSVARLRWHPPFPPSFCGVAREPGVGGGSALPTAQAPP